MSDKSLDPKGLGSEDNESSVLAAELRNERLLTAELQQNLSERIREVLVLLPAAKEHSLMELYSQRKRLELARLSHHEAASAFDHARMELGRRVHSLQGCIDQERLRMKAELEEMRGDLAKLTADAQMANAEWLSACHALEVRASRAEEMLESERHSIAEVIQRAVAESVAPLEERLEEQQRTTETMQLRLMSHISELEEQVRKRDEELMLLEATAEEWTRSHAKESKKSESRMSQLLNMSQGFIYQSDLRLSMELDVTEKHVAHIESVYNALKTQVLDISQQHSLLAHSVRTLGGCNADLLNQNQALTKENQQLLFSAGLREGQSFLDDLLSREDEAKSDRARQQDGTHEWQLEETLSTLGRLKRVFHSSHDVDKTIKAVKSVSITASPAASDQIAASPSISVSVTADGGHAERSRSTRAPPAVSGSSSIKVDERIGAEVAQ